MENQQKNARDAAETFDGAVMAFYLEHGRPCTASEVSEHSGVSISRIRMAVSEARYRCDCTTVDKPVFETNYRSLRCHRKVDAYQPSRAMLLARIRQLEIEAKKP